MKKFRDRARVVSIALISALTSLVGAPFARAQERGPLNLARASYFFVGGKIDTSVEGSPTVGLMYVEYMIPARRSRPYPIVMVHGGSQTGTNFTGTADGREGWAQYFVRRGYAVYCVDQPGRGRSAYLTDVYGPPRIADYESAQSRYLQQERTHLWPHAHLHNQWPGNGDLDDPTTREILSAFLPEIPFDKQQRITHAAMLDLADRIGPFIVLMHSQGGPIGWAIADARPDLVKAVVAVEPNGPPGGTVRFVGAPQWFEDGPAELGY